MQEHIDSCHKGSEIRTTYTEQNTAHFNNVENITIDSEGIFPQKKKNGRE